MIKKLPIPIAGLMLALAATGNLLATYGILYRSIFGLLSCFVFLLLLIKVLILPKSIMEGFQNPVVASVMPTFSMGLILLATYVKPYTIAYSLWLIGLALHTVFILAFTIKYITKFQITKVFPSYFIVYVGIVCVSVTAPIFNMVQLGQYIFWFGLVSYLMLLPIVLYRTFIVKNIPEPAIPTLVIYTAPASLCLAGYLNSFESKNILMVVFLAILSLLMFIGVIRNMPRLLKLQFYPSYSAFTFPFVITAIAIKSTNTFLINFGINISIIKYFVNILELWAVMIVIYVFIKYIIFMISNPEKAKV